MLKEPETWSYFSQRCQISLSYYCPCIWKTIFLWFSCTLDPIQQLQYLQKLLLKKWITSDRYPPIQFCFAILLLCEMKGKDESKKLFKLWDLKIRFTYFQIDFFFKEENQHLWYSCVLLVLIIGLHWGNALDREGIKHASTERKTSSQGPPCLFFFCRNCEHVHNVLADAIPLRETGGVSHQHWEHLSWRAERSFLHFPLRKGDGSNAVGKPL